MGAVLILALIGASASAKSRLVLVGGGPRPKAALERFVEWAGGRHARIAVVPWASEEQAESAEALAAELKPLGPATVDALVVGTANEAAGTAEVLRRATGIFFTGGDQRRLMDLIEKAGLGELLRSRYRAGCVFGGTSAGTAIMAGTMITGDGDFEVIDGRKVETRPGLGVLPSTLVDQHFVKRGRENRLFGLVLLHPSELGVGIDEGTAALVDDDRYLEVVGPTQVMIVDAGDASHTTPRTAASLRLHILTEGMRFDLKARRVL